MANKADKGWNNVWPQSTFAYCNMFTDTSCTQLDPLETDDTVNIIRLVELDNNIINNNILYGQKVLQRPKLLCNKLSDSIALFAILAYTPLQLLIHLMRFMCCFCIRITIFIFYATWLLTADRLKKVLYFLGNKIIIVVRWLYSLNL